MPTALVIHHDADSDAGIVGRHLVTSGWLLCEHTVCPRPGDATHSGRFPALHEISDIELLLLLGSRWSVYDTDAIGGWIHTELDLVRAAAEQRIRTWGICFGAQVIAAALGGTVEPSPVPEVGWRHIISDHPSIGGGPWFQWHGDRIVAPPGATVLATTPDNLQAFVVDDAVGVQFHPEVDERVLDKWLELDRNDLVDAGVNVSELIENTRAHQTEVTPRTVGLTEWATGSGPLLK